GGAHAAATLEPLIGSCTLRGIDPWFYLREVLDRIQDDPANRLGELTPRNWAATRQGHTGELG
ncbi:MAG: transposase domain-containing protein, partial [Deltaproteobacteria bacterium]